MYENLDVKIREAQGVSDVNSVEQVHNILRYNYYKLYAEIEGKEHTIGHILFLKGKIFVVPKHFLALIKRAVDYDSDTKLFCRSGLLKKSFCCFARDVVSSCVPYESPKAVKAGDETRDLMYGIFPTAICHRNIVSYFSPKRDLEYTRNVAMVLPLLSESLVKGEIFPVVNLKYTQGVSVIRRETIHVPDDDEKLMRCVRDVWEYTLDTTKGDCGAPIVLRNALVQGKIIGIHIAGQPKNGIGNASLS